MNSSSTIHEKDMDIPLRVVDPREIRTQITLLEPPNSLEEGAVGCGMPNLRSIERWNCLRRRGAGHKPHMRPSQHPRSVE